VMGIALAAGIFLAGWTGLAAVAAAGVAAWLLSWLSWLSGSSAASGSSGASGWSGWSGGRGNGWAIGLIAIAGCLAAVLAASSPWPDGSAGMDSALVQALVLFGFALAALSPGAPAGGTSPGGGDTS
jgi:arabinofuranan 3-O-arabinosyltransferase